jgi:hypothetical protein
MMRYLKILGSLGLLAILASNVWSMSHWTEARGVNDDFCYLRQAHLFQQRGLGGLDTDIHGDDDHYLSTKMGEMGLPTWKDPLKPPCHSVMAATNKFVMQYPPGTGFVMALFPQGHQVIPLFVAATVAIAGFGLFAIFSATTMFSLVVSAVFADLAVYLMINPSKASYSMAPTMAFCALVGFLTARLFTKTSQRNRIFLTMLIGFLIGITANFRLANLFLSAGFFLFFLSTFLKSRNFETLLSGGLFGVAFLAGIAPTLIANTINAGGPLTTTYAGGDAVAPAFDAEVLWLYVTDLQFVLLVLAVAWAAWMLCTPRSEGIRQVALVTALNLFVNLAFFLSHPVFTPYYTIPIAMLSLWSLLFASVMQPVEVVDDRLVGQAAKARA